MRQAFRRVPRAPGNVTDAEGSAMHALLRSLGPALLCCLLPLCLSAQEIEPYQMIGAAFGWGAVGPSQDTGLGGDAADAGGSVQFGLDIELRRAPRLYLYGRVDADAAEVRQHLGLSGGIRWRPVREGAIRPVIGFGIGLYWLEPKAITGLALQREFALRGDGHIGAEWLAAPGLRWFIEYRLTASRYRAVAREGDCTPIDRCLSVSDDALLHLAHTGWFGLRIRLF